MLGNYVLYLSIQRVNEKSHELRDSTLSIMTSRI